MTGSIRLAVLIVALCASQLISTPAKARRVLPIYGAHGDGQVSLECPENHVLAGFGGRTGLWIDQVFILCKPLNEDGTFGPMKPSNKYAGGTGGGDRNNVACPQSARLTDLSITLNPDGKQIEDLVGRCSEPSGAAKFFSFGALERPFGKPTSRQQSCGAEHAVGIAVNSGLHVNGVGLICDSVEPLSAKVVAKPSGPTIVHISAMRGGWNTRTSTDGYFTVILIPAHDGIGPLANQAIPVTGQFINAQGAHDYDGTLQGVIPPYSRTLQYSYVQKNGAAGTGVFTLSNDGNALTGSGKTNDGTSFTWNGTRAK